MPELLSPGVVIREVPFGPQPIEGVSTSTAGFVGEAAWGPTTGQPLLVTSTADFTRKFGGPDGTKVLPLAIRGFFDNGGRRAFVSRVVGAGAKAARLTVISGGANTRLRAITVDKAAAKAVLTLSSVVGVTIDNLSIVLKPFAGSADIPLEVTSVNAAVGQVEVAISAGALDAVTAASHFVAINGTSTSPPSADLQIVARYEGEFGRSISALLEAETGETTTVLDAAAAPPDDTYRLARVGFLRVDDRVLITRGGPAPLSEIAKVTNIDAGARQVQFAFASPAAPDVSGATLARVAWRADVFVDGQQVESLSGLPARVAANGAVDLAQAIATRSQWIRVSRPGDATLAPLIDVFAQKYPTFAFGAPQPLSGGSDGAGLGALDVIGADTPRSGLRALEAQEGISIIAAPGFTEQAVVNELLGQAERLKDRFAVFESEGAIDEPTTVLAQRGNYNSKYGAMYYPWVRVLDPVSRTNISLPPSGHVIGAYARTDNDRGVFKAPANVALRNILGFSREVSTGEQDLLNPSGVDVLRRLDGLGDVIWGARTVSSDSLWRYVPVRRLFIFLEQSIVRGTRYAVFEPNDQRLWARLHDSITNFLTSQWRAGALFGQTPDEAFFVKVDETTTTQDDRDNGRVNIIIGIAPVKPAEFVVFQIGQAPSSVIVSEQG